MGRYLKKIKVVVKNLAGLTALLSRLGLLSRPARFCASVLYCSSGISCNSREFFPNAHRSMKVIGKMQKTASLYFCTPKIFI